MLRQEQSVNNLVYFEASSMKELYECMKSWQEDSGQFFLQLNIQKDGKKFSCIALVIAEGVEQIATKSEKGWSLKLLKKEYRDAMARFERKALRIIVSENNMGADVNYATDDIAPEKILAIQSKLKTCTTAKEIKAVFREELFR